MNLKTLLESKLTEKQMESLRTSFDIIGDVAVIEIPEELRNKEKEIAKALIKTHSHVMTVCKKLGGRKGTKRLRDFEVIFTKKVVTPMQTIHKEHGCLFKLDVSKTYFSPRESTERLRIAEKVKPGEKILVMFGGIAPLPIMIAKKQGGTKKIYSVEINPDATMYARENVVLNNVIENIVTVEGDVKDFCKKIREKFDRILMPLPEQAYKYLDSAFLCCKKGGIIHLYGISKEKRLFKDLEKKIERRARESKRKIKIVDRKKVLPYRPREWKVCIDFEVK